jgi:GT2 family glycosyltransferase
MERPLLSVVMPTYNGAAHLAASLASIHAQSDPGIEVLAVDDGSTDETLQILESFQDRLTLSITRRSHSGNWVSSTNVGLAAARGEWVCFLHQDDVWEPDRVVRLRKLSAEHSEGTLLLSATRFIGHEGKRLNQWRCPLPGAKLIQPRLIIPRLLVQNFLAVPAPLFRRSLAIEVGGMDEELWYTADWDFWLKLAAVAKTLYLPAPLVCMRVHAVSQTMTRSNRSDEFRRQMEAVLERHLAPWEASHPREPSVRGVAQFSIDTNVALAAAFHGQKSAWRPLAARFLGLGPRGWTTYLRYSRVLERVHARLRSRR